MQLILWKDEIRAARRGRKCSLLGDGDVGGL